VANRRVLVVGTGTGIGKTHVGCALLTAWGEAGERAVGLKPIESGVTGSEGEVTDQTQLWEASQVFHVKRGTPSTFHVKRALYAWPDPVSPHLAARRAQTEVDFAAIERWIETHAAPVVVIETAGALFSPIAPRRTNLDLTLALNPSAVLLVAPDRLGVLHEVTATVGFASARGLRIDAVVLSGPEQPDASTGHNAPELALLGIANPLAVFPRAPVGAPSSQAAATTVIRWFDSSGG
jgi:dethiobiotin synthetase